MLQQTRVETVLPYYERFVTRFPTVQALADADEEDVLHAWAGLGYYARARNLKRAAERIAHEHAGQLPRDADALAALPGVGPYTVGAVRSIAFGERAGVVDGNVKRVLSRLVGEPRLEPAELWALAEELVPPRAPGDFNQALMELGARICTPRAPRCLLCPLRSRCRARAAGQPESYPARTPRRPPREVTAIAGVLARTRSGPQILLVRRTADGLLGGLWELPASEGAVPAALEKRLDQELGLRTRAGDLLGGVRHVFTHRVLTLQVVALEGQGGRLRQPRSGRGIEPAWQEARWCRLEGVADLPLSALASKALALIPR